MRFSSRLIVVLLIATFFILSCSSDKSVNQTAKVIYVSIVPQKYLVEKIAGEVFTVKNLLPPGASPATFEPSPAQLRDLSKAKAYLRIGQIGFEKAWMERIKNINTDMKIYDQSVGVDFIESDHSHNHSEDSYKHQSHEHGSIDPHIWTSTSQMYIQIENIKDMLVELEPDSAKYFETNFEKLKMLITATDKTIMTMFEHVEKRTFMIYHPSLSYFARDYGLIQLSLEYEGKEPSGKYMIELIEKSKELGINRVFIQKQFPDSKAKAIAKEMNAEIVKIDPLAYDWPDNMILMAEKIQKSLVE